MVDRVNKRGMNPQMASLFVEFARYFELSLALTEEQKAAVYRVRYNVYCEEFGYEDVQAFKDGLERDSFDAQSLHCLVTHRPSGRPAGCVRLVIPHGDSKMPFEAHCGDALDLAFMEGMKSRRESMAEISRLAVDGQFRRRRGESETRFGATDALYFAAREKRTFSLIALSLFMAATAVADLLVRKECFAIMEPFLPALLRRTGVTVRRVGEDIEFKGVRAPYYLNIDETVRTGHDELRSSYEAIRAQFAEVLLPRSELKASRADALATVQVAGDPLRPR